MDAWEAFGIRKPKRLPAVKGRPMRKVKIVRDAPSTLGTFGVLTAGTFSCYSAERNWHNNEKDISSIPPGTYRCELKESPRFGLVYHVSGVPNRSDILIHKGNFAADEGHGKSDILGCILLGNAIGEICGQKALLSSKDAIARFEAEMEGEPFDLTITES